MIYIIIYITYILRIYIDYIYVYVYIYIYIYHTNICSTYSSEVSSWKKLKQNVIMLTRSTIKIF